MTARSLSLGYSPCPNDTFIFYALVNNKIDTAGLKFREMLKDVETLNTMAKNKELDITKVSFHALGHLREDYLLLPSGGALGKGCGPLVVSKTAMDMKELKGKKIAIPGELTTAFLLLKLFDPDLGSNIITLPFHLIMDAVHRGIADAGLIIHESRFTYEAAGLCKVIDLGDWWEEYTGLPIPLGGIIAKRSLGETTAAKISSCIRQSIEYAFSRPEEPLHYIRQHSQELNESVIRQHIGLYVNDYSLDFGEEGLRAIETFFNLAEEKGLIPTASGSLLK